MSHFMLLQDDAVLKTLRTPTLSLCIAVSGGADSMALLHMLVLQKRPDQMLVALTVDHGLRPDSKTETNNVARYCASLNIDHHILIWHDTKPTTAIQNTARTARRRLLIAKCKDLDVADLYLAHQADDQAETLLQRLARGAGPNGLAGIQPVTTQEGITIHRPLLNTRRAALRDYCVQHHIPFHDDPSNTDTRFERVRWRQTIVQIEQTEPNFVMGLLRSQKRLAAAADMITQQAAEFIVAHGQRDAGYIILPHDALRTTPHIVIVEILRQLMTTGKAYKVNLERLEDWVAQAFPVPDKPVAETAVTLGGWWLQLKKNYLLLCRAPKQQS